MQPQPSNQLEPTVHSSSRAWLLVIVPILVGIAVTLTTAASAIGLSVRASVYHLGVSVRPGADLGDGQFVRVTWHGLGPQHPVFFRQCTAAPKNTARDCTALYSDTGFTGPNGTGVQYEPVHSGSIRSQSGRKFGCTRSNPDAGRLHRSGAELRQAGHVALRRHARRLPLCRSAIRSREGVPTRPITRSIAGI